MIDRDVPWQCLAALGGISWQQRRTEKRYGGRSCRAISTTNLPRHLFWDFSGLTCPSLIRGRESKSGLWTALYALSYESTHTGPIPPEDADDLGERSIISILGDLALNLDLNSKGF